MKATASGCSSSSCSLSTLPAAPTDAFDELLHFHQERPYAAESDTNAAEEWTRSKTARAQQLRAAFASSVVQEWAAHSQRVAAELRQMHAQHDAFTPVLVSLMVCYLCGTQGDLE